MCTGHFSSLVHDPECSQKDRKEHTNAQDSRKPEMSRMFVLIQFISCSARKLESIANQAQLVLVLASQICLLSCNNLINTACQAWRRGFVRCRETQEVIQSVWQKRTPLNFLQQNPFFTEVGMMATYVMQFDKINSKDLSASLLFSS